MCTAQVRTKLHHPNWIPEEREKERLYDLLNIDVSD